MFCSSRVYLFPRQDSFPFRLWGLYVNPSCRVGGVDRLFQVHPFIIQLPIHKGFLLNEWDENKIFIFVVVVEEIRTSLSRFISDWNRTSKNRTFLVTSRGQEVWGRSRLVSFGFRTQLPPSTDRDWIKVRFGVSESRVTSDKWVLGLESRQHFEVESLYIERFFLSTKDGSFL